MATINGDFKNNTLNGTDVADFMTGQGGNDVIVVSDGLKLPSELYAGNGNNVLIGGGGDNLLVGGAGNNVLIGGRGRNVLIGGAGKDRIFGRGRDDILIAGTTDYGMNEAALRAILADWEHSLPRRLR